MVNRPVEASTQEPGLAKMVSKVSERAAPWNISNTKEVHFKLEQVKIYSQMTRKPNTQNRAPLMCLSGQPALKVRLAASSKRDGNEWAWAVNVASTAAAVRAERTCEVAGGAAQNARAVLWARFYPPPQWGGWI